MSKVYRYNNPSPNKNKKQNNKLDKRKHNKIPNKLKKTIDSSSKIFQELCANRKHLTKVALMGLSFIAVFSFGLFTNEMMHSIKPLQLFNDKKKSEFNYRMPKYKYLMRDPMPVGYFDNDDSSPTATFTLSASNKDYTSSLKTAHLMNNQKTSSLYNTFHNLKYGFHEFPYAKTIKTGPLVALSTSMHNAFNALLLNNSNFNTKRISITNHKIDQGSCYNPDANYYNITSDPDADDDPSEIYDDFGSLNPIKGGYNGDYYPDYVNSNFPDSANLPLSGLAKKKDFKKSLNKYYGDYSYYGLRNNSANTTIPYYSNRQKHLYDNWTWKTFNLTSFIKDRHKLTTNSSIEPKVDATSKLINLTNESKQYQAKMNNWLLAICQYNLAHDNFATVMSHNKVYFVISNDETNAESGADSYNTLLKQIAKFTTDNNNMFYLTPFNVYNKDNFQANVVNPTKTQLFYDNFNMLYMHNFAKIDQMHYNSLHHKSNGLEHLPAKDFFYDVRIRGNGAVNSNYNTNDNQTDYDNSHFLNRYINNLYLYNGTQHFVRFITDPFINAFNFGKIAYNKFYQVIISQELRKRYNKNETGLIDYPAFVDNQLVKVPNKSELIKQFNKNDYNRNYLPDSEYKHYKYFDNRKWLLEHTNGTDLLPKGINKFNSTDKTFKVTKSNICNPELGMEIDLNDYGKEKVKPIRVWIQFEQQAKDLKPAWTIVHDNPDHQKIFMEYRYVMTLKQANK